MILSYLTTNTASMPPSTQCTPKAKAIYQCLSSIGIAFCFLAINASAQPLTRTFTHDDVSATFTITPSYVDAATDTELTITLATPAGLQATLPADLTDRFDGFTVAGSYATDASATDVAAPTMHFRLIPVPGAPHYRIRPIAITVEDASTHPPAKSWFPTEIIRIDTHPPATEAPQTVETDLEAKYIRPSFKTVPKIIGYTLLGAVLLGLIFLGLGKIRLAHKIRRMTPLERALRELDSLMQRNLPEKGLFKDFYVELTLVVRRYIERRHGIQAPEQTTEEFLAAAAQHTHFNPTSLGELKAFLEAADLVKFAGISATVSTTTEAVKKAREYITHDPVPTARQADQEDTQ